MSEQNRTESASLPAARRFLPLLLLLFAGSGCSALIYEIVWCQVLQLVIGSSAVSLGVLLGTFMGGMCLGSIALPRLISPRFHPLRVYALLELGLGIMGIALPFGMPYVDRIYTESAGHGLPAMLLRGAVCAACLVPPTVLMGATLPAIARWIETTPQGISWLGFFYGGNIAGAVFGCLLAGFYLLRVHDQATATYVAAALNAAVALLSLGLATVTRHQAPAADSTEYRVRSTHKPEAQARETASLACASGFTPHSVFRTQYSWPVYVTIALSGSCALAAEVIWTRLLSLMLGATVYTFSIILAVFLVGLGIGSSLGSFLARANEKGSEDSGTVPYNGINSVPPFFGARPRILLAFCQLLLVPAIAWTATMLAKSLPYWPIDPSLSSSPWFNFQLDLVRCLWAILPATCLWGASFPLALAAAATRGQDPGQLVGGVYAANTVGAIVGAIGSSLFLIRWLGTQEAQRVLIGLSTLAALLLLVPRFWPFRRNALSGQRDRPLFRSAGALLLVASIAGPALFLAWSVPGVPWELVAFGRSIVTYDGQWEILYLGEGMNSSIAVTEASGGRNFHVSGKVEASSYPPDMRLQRMLGHLPAMFHSKPRSVLVVGFGAGVTSGSFVVHPEIESIVICEIEPLIPQAVAPYFTEENYDVVSDPRVEIIYDDARHYVLTTPHKFDIITSDPIHPWVKGSATLYTKEYFELCKRHLNPGGLITQWVPLYETNVEVVKSEIATFFEVFPEGTIWSNNDNGQGYDIVLLGQAEALKIDADELQLRLDRPDHAAVKKSLEDVGFRTVVGLLATYSGQASDLGPWLKNAEINRDRNLRLQYLAGFQVDTKQSKLINDVLLNYCRFPEKVLTGSGWRSQAVKIAITRSIVEHQTDMPFAP